MNPISLFLLPLAPYPVLAYVASSHPALLLFLLPLYFALPLPLYVLSRSFLPFFKGFQPLALSAKHLQPYPHLAALILPYLGYWGLAPLAWTFPQAYRGWLLTAGFGVPLSLFLAFVLGKVVPPFGVALATLFLWKVVGKGIQSLARSF